MGKMDSSRRFIPYVVIAFLSILVYINALDNGFHYDDEHDIVTNSFLGKWENIPLLFSSAQFYQDKIIGTDHYRPVVYVTYAFNKIIGGNNPFGYHLVNLAFHIGSAFLVFLIVRAMLGTGYFAPLAAGLIFAVHPFNSEVVNYITARSSVMSGFFYLLAFYCWVRYRGEKIEDRSKTKSYLYLGSLFAFLFGMLCKEVVITLPVVLWLYDIYFVHPRRTPLHSILRRLFNWHTYLPYLPFVLAVVVPALIIRIIYWGGVVTSFKRSLLVQLYTSLPVLVKHLRFFVFPVGLNVDHSSEIYRSFFAWTVAGSAVVIILYILLAVLAYRARSIEWKVVSFFMLWFFIVLLPIIVIPLNVIFQENRGYLAIIVFTVLAGIMLGKLNKNTHVAILIILVFLYGAGTVYRNGVWQDGIRLWSDAAAKSPESSRAYTNLGTEYSRRGMNEAAIGSFLKALRFSGSDGGAEPANIHYNIGTVYQQMSRNDMAVREYLSVIDLSPLDFRPWYNLGVIYQQKGEAEAAMKAYEMVIERNRSHFKSYHNIGLIYHNRSETSLAAEYYRKALSINPGYARSRVNLEAINKEEGDNR